MAASAVAEAAGRRREQPRTARVRRQAQDSCGACPDSRPPGRGPGFVRNQPHDPPQDRPVHLGVRRPTARPSSATRTLTHHSSPVRLAGLSDVGFVDAGSGPQHGGAGGRRLRVGVGFRGRRSPPGRGPQQRDPGGRKEPPGRLAHQQHRVGVGQQHLRPARHWQQHRTVSPGPGDLESAVSSRSRSATGTPWS